MFSSGNLLQLVVFAVLIGSSIAVLGEKAKTIKNILNEGTNVILNVVGIIMKLGPIGLGCYTASIIGELGQEYNSRLHKGIFNLLCSSCNILCSMLYIICILIRW
ncbi:cation:dicarboxylase symporter family transporter [Paraclostridium bifermentans]|nr:cation:dicarboxylase symporter family transporter [Paraclostridium bifermentans]